MSDEKPKRLYLVNVTLEIRAKELNEAVSRVGYCFDYHEGIELVTVQGQLAHIQPDPTLGIVESSPHGGLGGPGDETTPNGGDA